MSLSSSTESGLEAKGVSPLESDASFTRRGFLAWASGCTVSAVSGLLATGGMFRFLIPNVRYEPSPRVFLETPELYPQGVTYVETSQIYLIRTGNRFRALSGICTHLGCSLTQAASGRGFNCPCHGSRFDQNGKVLKGPATEPLPWLAMEQSADGRLVVDRSKTVSESSILQV